MRSAGTGVFCNFGVYDATVNSPGRPLNLIAYTDQVDFPATVGNEFFKFVLFAVSLILLTRVQS